MTRTFRPGGRSARGVQQTPAKPSGAGLGEMSRVHSVLVVDDEPEVRALYADSLSESGHVVEVATDGVAAIHRLRSEPLPCVVLADAHMPHMDGWDLQRMVERDPQLASVPVVVLTGDRILSLISPARDKPFDPVELDALVHRSCALHREERRSATG